MSEQARISNDGRPSPVSAETQEVNGKRGLTGLHKQSASLPLCAALQQPPIR